MQRTRYSTFALVLALGLFASVAANAGDGRTCPGATPNPNGAQISERVFNDCPITALVSNNLYPALISISDQNYICLGGANLHTWSFSEDAGLTKAQFENCSSYSFCADVRGEGQQGELGLRLAPWWSPDADGKFMLNLGGEIACFGGRLPFYSFTGAFGIHYVNGSVVHMEVIYTPNGLSDVSPATVEYKVTMGGPTFSSGPLAFDSGNLGEDPPHGLWGELVPAYAGGYVQLPGTATGTPVGILGTFGNICYYNNGVTATKASTWGGLKLRYR